MTEEIKELMKQSYEWLWKMYKETGDEKYLTAGCMKEDAECGIID